MFQIKYFPGDALVNADIFAVCSILGCVTSAFVYKKLGVSKSFGIMFFIITVAGLNIALWGYDSMKEGNKWAFPLLVALAVYGLTSCFNLVYVTHTHIFPTLFSATAMGICNFIARIATCAAPEVAETPGTTGMWIMTSLCFIALCLTFFLKLDK
jgi:hypothetical protein